LLANVLGAMALNCVHWACSDLIVFLLSQVVLFLLGGWFFLLVDLSTSSLSAWFVTFDTDDFYNQPRSGNVYDNWAGVVVVFD